MPSYYCANCGNESSMYGHWASGEFKCEKPSPEEYEENVQRSKTRIAAAYGQSFEEMWGEDEA